MTVRTTLLAWIAASLVAVAPASAATTAVDGPDAGIPDMQTVAVDMAPDGTAALAYLKADHVYVSRLVGGAWTGPARVDTGLDTHPSRNVALAVANGGKVVVTFGNGPAMNANIDVYSAIKPNAAAACGAPQVLLSAGGRYADVDLAPGGNGYAAIGTFGGGGSDVFAKRLDGTTWTPVGAEYPDFAAGSLDADTNHPAGETGDQRGARVAVAPDGQSAVVTFTEEENVGEYDVVARRLTGTSRGPAAEAEVADFGGFPASSSGADMADVDMDASGTAWVVMRHGVEYGMATHPRCLARPLSGNAFGAAQLLDALPTPPGNDACEFPRVDVTPGGLGLVAGYHQMTYHVDASTLAGGTWATPFQVNVSTADAPARTAVALGDQGSGLIAWRHDPGGGADKRVLARTRLSALSDELTLSDPGFGTVNTSGLEAAGDAGARAVVAFTQGSAATTRVVAAVVDLPQPPQDPPGGGDPPPDTTRPVVSGLELSARRFRLGRRLASAAAARTGTRIRYALSEPARVVVRFARAAPGRRAGGRCVKPTRRNRARRRCTRFVRVKRRLAFDGQPAGARSIRFQGRLTRKRSLRPGRHRLTLRARDAAGNVSDPASARFKLLPRKRRR